MNSWRSLLDGLIDYAGLFPPASLDMRSAVEEFHRSKESDDSYILCRFVLPVGRLGEFSEAVRAIRAEKGGGTPWQLSVIADKDAGSTVGRLLEFNREQSRSSARLAVCDSIEIPAASVEEIRGILKSVPEFFRLYVEIPLNAPALIAELAGSRASAKMRTGGVVASAIPEAQDVLRCMRACHENEVSFKATAGLHHAMRGNYPLTYETGSGVGKMFGYLNVFLAAAFMKQGLTDTELLGVLEETSPNAFVFSENAVSWNEHTASAQHLENVRQKFARSFGSCSFTEPVAEASELGLSHANR